MCLLSKRKFHGTELSSDYCKLIEERINITINPPLPPSKVKKEKPLNPIFFEES
jgi:DNA modification methylase